MQNSYSEFIVSFFLFKQKTAYEMRISDWSSDVCSSDLRAVAGGADQHPGQQHADRVRAAAAADRGRDRCAAGADHLRRHQAHRELCRDGGAVHGGGYILVALVIMAFNWERVPAMFELIMSSAFGLHAGFGTMLGLAVEWGVKRGIYSNEAGQGTGPHAAAAAEVQHPDQQGVVQAFAVYVDTLLVCSARGIGRAS